MLVRCRQYTPTLFARLCAGCPLLTPAPNAANPAVHTTRYGVNIERHTGTTRCNHPPHKGHTRAKATIMSDSLSLLGARYAAFGMEQRADESTWEHGISSMLRRSDPSIFRFSPSRVCSSRLEKGLERWFTMPAHIILLTKLCSVVLDRDLTSPAKAFTMAVSGPTSAKTTSSSECAVNSWTREQTVSSAQNTSATRTRCSCCFLVEQLLHEQTRPGRTRILTEKNVLVAQSVHHGLVLLQLDVAVRWAEEVASVAGVLPHAPSIVPLVSEHDRRWRTRPR